MNFSGCIVNVTFGAVFGLEVTVLTCMVLLVVIGNLAVILAVLKNRRLHNANFLFILSLAAADCSVGFVVLPFAVSVNLLGGTWLFGPVICQLWTATDIWLCTNSIYHLVLIAIDRFIALVRPLKYISWMTPTIAKTLIAGAWTAALFVSFPATISAMITQFNEPIANSCSCTVLSSPTPVIAFSGMFSFVLPYILILALYFRIYIIVRKATAIRASGRLEIKRKRTMSQASVNSVELNSAGGTIIGGGSLADDCLRVHIPDSRRPSVDAPRRKMTAPESRVRREGPTLQKRKINRALMKQPRGKTLLIMGTMISRCPEVNHAKNLTSAAVISNGRCNSLTPAVTQSSSRTSSARTARKTRLQTEITALKSVSVVTAAFFVCWLGFSVSYLSKLAPSCRETDCFGETIMQVFTWLGYANSAMNPLIYAACNREFRRSFKAMLCPRSLRNMGRRNAPNRRGNSAISSDFIMEHATML